MSLILLIASSLVLYGRGGWIAINGSTLNPGVMLVAAPLSFLIYVWILSDDTQQDSQRKDGEASSVPKPHPKSLTCFSLLMTCVGAYYSLMASQRLALSSGDGWALWARELGFIGEGLGLIGLWTSWTYSHFSPALCARLYYPLSTSLFSLPWESFLRSYDQHLQELSADVAVRTLDLIDWLFTCSPPLKIGYWDSITLYSERFYLIINETCAGINLFISMSLYTLGFSWIMGASIQRATILITYILPLSILFNGLRIAIIFCLGHFGDKALATGAWHEGSAYLSQAALFVIIALINAALDREQVSGARGPSV